MKEKSVFVIPTPINSEIFKPGDSQSSRRLLNLPYHKKIILFGAMNLKDVRKGFKYLIEALQILNKTNKFHDVELAVFGKLDEKVLSSIPYKVNQLGQLKTDNEIISAYNAADVFVAPSLEDNLPNTIMESLACGKPVVAFGIGGIPDMIDHLENGYLAKARSVDDLAKGINWYFDNQENINKLRFNAREKVVKNYSQEVVAKKYKELYSSLIQN
jgi:glycosyltransferase involved in cell wall biosynthesis